MSSAVLEAPQTLSLDRELDQVVIDVSVAMLATGIPEHLTFPQCSAVHRWVRRGKTTNRFILDLRAQAVFSPILTVRQLSVAAKIMVGAIKAYMDTTNQDAEVGLDGHVRFVPRATSQPTVSLAHVGTIQPREMVAEPATALYLPSLEDGLCGIYTHEQAEGHVTFRIKPLVYAKPEPGEPAPDRLMYLGQLVLAKISRLVGPDNGSDYMDKGWVVATPEGPKAMIWRKTPDQHLHKALIALAAGETVLRSRFCCVCGRRLTRPSSISVGMGPDCAGE